MVYGRLELPNVIASIVNPTPREVIKMKAECRNHPKFGGPPQSLSFSIIF